MLLELNISNFAIIKDLNVQFTKGLNIITGETGTGKSILIDALGILLGSRSSKEFIRTGEEISSLEAVFYIENIEGLNEVLEEYGIIIDSDNLLIINKQISMTGPSLSKINGKNVNLTMLNNITRNLVDIFGQHEHQSLLNISNHRLLLDSFGDKDFSKLKEDFIYNYKLLDEAKKHLDSISLNLMERDREIDMLNFQISEIEESQLDVKNDSNVEIEYKKTLNLNKIKEVFSSVLNFLNGIDFESTGVIDGIITHSIELEKISGFDNKIFEILERFKSIQYELDDVNVEFSSFIEDIDFNENELFELESRLDLINRLKNKYGNTIEEILEFKSEAEVRLETLLNQEKEIENIQYKINQIESILETKSNEITNIRKKIAQKLEIAIQNELELLNMCEIKFKVDFQKLSYYSINGIDKIEFLISTNLGEELKPLSKIASGGEMSRIMLAFKNILAKYDKIQTMIFDEIDTGISGRTAQIVGEKIYSISKEHQVICISHLPQITALADSHYVIGKETLDNKTGSYIRQLDLDERVEELARLIGGVDLTETTLKHALEMIEMSNKIK